MPRKTVLAVLLIALIFTGILLVNATPLIRAQTATVITSNTMWSKADSPKNLVGNVLVKDGATLTIEAGVRVNLGNFYIRVENAALTARGFSSEKIYFEGNGELSGIYLVDCKPWNEQTAIGSIIENSVINFASISCSNAKVSNSLITSDVSFSDSNGIFSNNQVTGDISMADATICTASYNTFSGNFEIRGSPTITHNTITGDLTITGSDTDKPEITHNIIEGAITQFHACVTLSYNELKGEVSLSGEPSTVTYNTFHSELSLSYANSTISNNNFVGGEVGIGIGTIFHNIHVIITDNIVEGCSDAGIRAKNEYDSSGTITLLIRGNMLKDCNYGIDLSGVESTIEGNLFMNNKIGLIGGSSIQHNSFSGNDVGVDSLGSVHHNNFLNNKYGFSLQSPQLWVHDNVNATYNWWGTTDSEAIKQTLFDSKNDFELGTIAFEPFLTSPDPTAPSISYQPTVGPSTENTPTNSPSTQTITPTPASSQSIAETQPSTQVGTFSGLELRDLTIIFLGITVAVLVVLILLLAHRKKK